jgi:hypothetical protein
MASVVSKLKTPSNDPAEDPTLKAGTPVVELVQRAERLVQQAEQSSDPLLRELVAAIIMDIHGHK